MTTPPGPTAVNDPVPTGIDGFLDDRIRIEQPLAGYRAAIDPVLLAASLDPLPGARVLDAGAGAGTAALCLAHRRPDLKICTLERDEFMSGLASANIVRNTASERMWAVHGDLVDPPADLGTFDAVISNPPYFDPAKSTPGAHPLKQAANVFDRGDLILWIKSCLKLVAPKGTISLILRTESLDQALAALGRGAGGVLVYPLWPKAAVPAKRILIRARKAARAPMKILPGLVLHSDDGKYTAAARAVLRDGAALNLQAD